MPELLDFELADDPNETHAAGDGVHMALPSRGLSIKEMLANRKALVLQAKEAARGTRGAPSAEVEGKRSLPATILGPGPEPTVSKAPRATKRKGKGQGGGARSKKARGTNAE
ncbi:hypothetical protein FRC08_006882 [Ceratobasidium sp. 394]|nr:hypothetical protein FRC08_006882 [Ceratobasidium sp. 394]KAG9100101.1 hypothetical protein FS749_016291 [Ceratobasidium sp. UAMH 11750]